MELVHARTPESKATPSDDAEQQEALRQRGEIPSHIAVIMDGNGRWAKKRGRNRFFGHTEGVTSVRDVAEACAELGVEYLTLYTFSTENWQRPALEVQSLMQLLVRTIRRERETLLKNNIRLNAIGNLRKLPPACRAELEETIRATAEGHKMTLTLALSYSGRWELVNAMQEIARRVQSGELEPEEIDESVIEDHLCTVGMPDPALLIRTGGELRVSNYLLWQLAYTELYVTERFWPEFRRSNLYEAVRSYQDRERRFGRVVA
ncbi:MAG TPA: isoprenyl transferase [Rhodothermales bacterium]|nr:isoprenyl transferase [Rhodothermales bacterium]